MYHAVVCHADKSLEVYGSRPDFWDAYEVLAASPAAPDCKFRAVYTSGELANALLAVEAKTSPTFVLTDLLVFTAEAAAKIEDEAQRQAVFLEIRAYREILKLLNGAD